MSNYVASNSSYPPNIFISLALAKVNSLSKQNSNSYKNTGSDWEDTTWQCGEDTDITNCYLNFPGLLLGQRFLQEEIFLIWVKKMQTRLPSLRFFYY